MDLLWSLSILSKASTKFCLTEYVRETTKEALAKRPVVWKNYRNFSRLLLFQECFQFLVFFISPAKKVYCVTVEFFFGDIMNLPPISDWLAVGPWTLVSYKKLSNISR